MNEIQQPTPTTPTLSWVVLFVSDIERSVELYSAAFGLTVAFAHPGGDYAEFATGATALALCDRALAAESTGLSLDGPTSPRSNITLVVPDVSAAFEKATSAGARSVTEPVAKPWGQTTCYVADLDGNLIELATAVAGGDVGDGGD